MGREFTAFMMGSSTAVVYGFILGRSASDSVLVPLTVVALVVSTASYALDKRTQREGTDQ